jgi:hypothetical protein
MLKKGFPSYFLVEVGEVRDVLETTFVQTSTISTFWYILKLYLKNKIFKLKVVFDKSMFRLFFNTYKHFQFFFYKTCTFSSNKFFKY